MTYPELSLDNIHADAATLIKSLSDLKLLDDLQQQITQHRKDLFNIKRVAAIDQCRTIMHDVGMTIAELANSAAPLARREAKYRHPHDSSQEWSGMGRKPNWVKDWLASGRALEEVAIKNQNDN